MPFHEDVHATMVAEELACNGCGAQVDERFDCCEVYEITDRAVLERSGYQVDSTPIDTLMRDTGCALSVAHVMEHGDDPYEC